MRTLIFCTALLMILLTSCSKSGHENIPKEDGQKFAIKFDISGFNQVIGDFDNNARSAPGTSTAKTDPDTLKKYINYIYFYVFANGGKLKEIRQISTDTAFGHIVDSMPAGNYNVVMVGSKDPVTIQPTLGGDQYLVFGLPGTDVFFKNVPISVSGAINQTMTLDRIVSKLKIIIKDKIPTGTKSITISLLSDPQRGGLEVVSMILSKLRLSSGKPEFDAGRTEIGYPRDVIGTDTLIGTENLSREYILFSMSSTKTVVNLLSKDAQGATISEKNIYDVTLLPGKRTVLSGNLFTTTSLDGVNTSINNAEWAKDSVLINF